MPVAPKAKGRPRAVPVACRSTWHWDRRRQPMPKPPKCSSFKFSSTLTARSRRGCLPARTSQQHQASAPFVPRLSTQIVPMGTIRDDRMTSYRHQKVPRRADKGSDRPRAVPVACRLRTATVRRHEESPGLFKSRFPRWARLPTVRHSRLLLPVRPHVDAMSATAALGAFYPALNHGTGVSPG